MAVSVQEKLRGMIERFGREICADPRRCEAVLRDLLGEAHKREIFLLVHAARERVATDLYEASAGLPIAVQIDRLVRRVQALGIAEDLARWSVENWALALGMLDASQVSRGLACPACQEVVLIPAGRSTGRLRCGACKSELELDAGGSSLRAVPQSQPQGRLVLPSPVQLGPMSPADQATFPLVLRNVGDQRCKVSLAPSDSRIGLNQSKCTIDPGSQCKITGTLRAAGLSPGQRHDFHVSVKSDGQEQQVAVQVAVRARQPQLRAIDPIRVARALQGHTAEATLVLANDGDGELQAELAGPADAPWVKLASRSVQVAPGKQAEVAVQFELLRISLAEEEDLSTYIDVHSNAGTCTVPVHLHVVQPKPACLTVNHHQVDLGDLSTGAEKDFEIIAGNSGDEPCEIVVVLEQDAWITTPTQRFTLGPSQQQTLKCKFRARQGGPQGAEAIEAVLLHPAGTKKALRVKVSAKVFKTGGPLLGVPTAVGLASLAVLPAAMIAVAASGDWVYHHLLRLIALAGIPLAIWLFGRLWAGEKHSGERLAIGLGAVLLWIVAAPVVDYVAGGIVRWVLSAFVSDKSAAMVVGALFGALAGFFLGFMAWIAIEENGDDRAGGLGLIFAGIGGLTFCLGGGYLRISPLAEFAFYALAAVGTGLYLAGVYPRATRRSGANPWMATASISPVLLAGLGIGGFVVAAAMPTPVWPEQSEELAFSGEDLPPPATGADASVVEGAWTGTLIQNRGGWFACTLDLRVSGGKVAGRSTIANGDNSGAFDLAGEWKDNTLRCHETKVLAQRRPNGGGWLLKAFELTLTGSPPELRGIWTGTGSGGTVVLRRKADRPVAAVPASGVRQMEWQAEDGAWRFEGPQVRAESSRGVHSESYGGLVLGGVNAADYTFSAKLERADASCKDFGLLFRAQDALNLYCLSPAGRKLLVFQKGVFREIGKFDADITNSLVEVRLSGSEIRIFADGQPIAEFQDGTYSHGRVGLFTWQDSAGCFRHVRQLPPGEQQAFQPPADWVPASSRKFRCGLALDLATPLDLDAAYAALRERYEVDRAGSGLIWQRLGARDYTAYVHASGRVIVAGAASAESVGDLASLQMAAGLVTTELQALAGTRPFDRWMMYSPRFYTEPAGVLKRLVVRMRGRTSTEPLQVTVPDCKVLDAMIASTLVPNGGGSVLFDGKEFAGWQWGSIADSLRFGTHQLLQKGGGLDMVMILAVCTPTTADLKVQGPELVVLENQSSQAMSSLRVPPELPVRRAIYGGIQRSPILPASTTGLVDASRLGARSAIEFRTGQTIDLRALAAYLRDNSQASVQLGPGFLYWPGIKDGVGEAFFNAAGTVVVTSGRAMDSLAAKDALNDLLNAALDTARKVQAAMPRYEVGEAGRVRVYAERAATYHSLFITRERGSLEMIVDVPAKTSQATCKWGWTSMIFSFGGLHVDGKRLAREEQPRDVLSVLPAGVHTVAIPQSLPNGWLMLETLGEPDVGRLVCDFDGRTFSDQVACLSVQQLLLPGVSKSRATAPSDGNSPAAPSPRRRRPGR